MNRLDTSFKIKEIILLICSIIFLTSFIIVLISLINNKNQMFEIDKRVVDFMLANRGDKNGFIYYLFKIITQFGFLYVLIALGIFILIYTRLDIRFIVPLGIILTALLINHILKNSIARIRPDDLYRWENIDSYSFPSSHSLASTILYSYLIYFTYKDNKMNKILKIIIIVFSIIIIPLVLISRMVLMVHYFTDVLAGFLLGMFFFIICIMLLEFFIKKEILIKPLINFKKKSED